MPRLVRRFSRALPLLAMAAVGACATAAPSSTRVTGRDAIASALDSVGFFADRAEGPQVRLRTEESFGNRSTIDAYLRLDDDAYVMVVNVGPDGYAQVLFPETPADDGLLRAGKSYKLPAFFPGFAVSNVSLSLSSGSAFVPYRKSEFASVMARGPGYVFVIASDEPMDFREAEMLGLWDEYRLPGDAVLYDPHYLVRWFRETVVPRGARGVSTSVARYAGWVPVTGRYQWRGNCLQTAALQQQWAGGAMFAAPIWAVSAMPIDLAPDCNMAPRLLEPWQRLRPIIVQPRDSSKVPHDSSGTPGTPGGTGNDSSGVVSPRPVKPTIVEVAPVPSVIADGPTVLLTPEVRRQARREALLERRREGIEGASGPVWTRRGSAGGRPANDGIEGRPRNGADRGSNASSSNTVRRSPQQIREKITNPAGSSGTRTPASPPPAPPRPTSSEPAPAPSPSQPAPPPA